MPGKHFEKIFTKMEGSSKKCTGFEETFKMLNLIYIYINKKVNSPNREQEPMGHVHASSLNSNTHAYLPHDTDENIRGE